MPKINVKNVSASTAEPQEPINRVVNNITGPSQPTPKSTPINDGNFKLGEPVKETLNQYLELLNRKSIDQIKSAVISLNICNTRIDWWDPSEILEQMRRKEMSGAARRMIVSFIEEAIRNRRPVGLTNAKFEESKHMKSVFVYRNKFDPPRKPVTGRIR